MAERAAGDHEAVGVDGVAGVGDEHDVAGGGDRHGEVGEALLGAEGGDHLGLGVELHAEAAGVVAGLGAAEAGDALGGRIAVGARAAHGFHKLFNDMGGRVHVGVAHAEVDDVHALGAVAGLEPVHLGEDVGGQALDAVELFGHGRTGAGGCGWRVIAPRRGERQGRSGGELTFPSGAAQAAGFERRKTPGRRLCEGMHNACRTMQKPCTSHAQQRPMHNPCTTHAQPMHNAYAWRGGGIAARASGQSGIVSSDLTVINGTIIILASVKIGYLAEQQETSGDARRRVLRDRTDRAASGGGQHLRGRRRSCSPAACAAWSAPAPRAGGCAPWRGRAPGRGSRGCAARRGACARR